MKPQNLPDSPAHSPARSTPQRLAVPWKTGGWRPLKILLPKLLLGLLTSCMASPPAYDSESPPPAPSASGADASATYNGQQPSPSASAATSQFNFPMTSCGDHASEPSETWYSVYIDGASLDDIRTRYCGDAVSATRGKSGNPTVQAASFTSYARALTLAKAIGGVVEQSASPDPTSGSASATPNSAASSSSAAPSTPAPGPTPAMQIGQSAYLNASEFGSPINIRSGASTSADVQTTGYAGDPVQISNSTQGDDGLTWYEVRLDSGTQGWVRGDLISTQAPVNQPSAQAPAYDSADSDPGSVDRGSANGSATPYDQPPYANQDPYSEPPYGQAPYGQAPYGQPPYANPAPQPSGQAPYGQAPYGQAPPGQRPSGQPYGSPNQGRPSTLTTREPGSSINIREGASMNARVRYRANPGDPIQVSGSAQGDDGFIWYQVRFSSGAVGWVRGDLVTTN